MTMPSTTGEGRIWEWGGKGRIPVGSDDHKNLFCRMLLDTFDPYEPAAIAWPDLDGPARERLTALPFWSVAIATEGITSLRVQRFADAIDDPLLREAVALNAFEERRHKDVLDQMTRFYGIDSDDAPDALPPEDPMGAFVKTGYGECFDSFFAFGLFKIARDSGFFAPDLVAAFEPVIQEEARHILFFVNWVRYAQKQRFVLARPAMLVRRFLAIAEKAWNRLSLARDTKGTNNADMTLKGHESMGIDLSPRTFLETCLAENARRLGRYDDRLLRPQFMPRLVHLALPLMKAR